MIEIPDIALSIEWLDPPRRPKTNLKTIQFLYPPNQFRFQQWQSTQQIQSYFNHHLPNQWKYTTNMYHLKKYPQNNHKIITKFKCKLCQAHLTLKSSLNTNQIHIYSFNNHHTHYINRKAKQTQEKLAQQFIKNRPTNESYLETIRKMMQQFEINRERARYIYSKYAGKATQSIKVVTDRIMATSNCQVKIWVDPKNPQKQKMVLLVTQTMMKSYQKYGDCLCFDITYRLVRKYHFYSKKNSQHQVQQWGTGFFIGQDSNLRLTLFGIALIEDETSQNIKNVFNCFFAMMSKKMPQSIVTDDQPAIVKALTDIKNQNNYKWTHLLDWFHKLQSLKRMMKKQKIPKQERGDLLRAYSRLLKQPNKVIFNQLVQQMQEYSNQNYILQSFLRDKHRYCISQIDRNFFGFSVSSARSQAFNNIIKIYIPYSTFPSRFFTQVLRCQKSLLSKNNNGIAFKCHNVHFSILKGIQHISLQIQQRIFQQLIKNNSKSALLDIVKIDTYKYNVYEQKYCYCLQNYKNFWCCQCKYIFHTGIPCIHLLIVIIKQNQDVLSYIKKRWIRSDLIIKQLQQNKPKQTQKNTNYQNKNYNQQWNNLINIWSSLKEKVDQISNSKQMKDS